MASADLHDMLCLQVEEEALGLDGALDGAGPFLGSSLGLMAQRI